MDFKRHIAKKLNIEGIGEDELVSMLALPPNTEMGDFARLALNLRKFSENPPRSSPRRSQDLFPRTNS